MKMRLDEISLEVSLTQPKTPADGNCMMWAIFDQLSNKLSSAQTNLRGGLGLGLGLP